MQSVITPCIPESPHTVRMAEVIEEIPTKDEGVESGSEDSDADSIPELEETEGAGQVETEGAVEAAGAGEASRHQRVI